MTQYERPDGTHRNAFLRRTRCAEHERRLLERWRGKAKQLVSDAELLTPSSQLARWDARSAPLVTKDAGIRAVKLVTTIW
jgi:hypothetical protein